MWRRYTSKKAEAENLMDDTQWHKCRWRSIRIAHLTGFLWALGSTCNISSIWPYLKQIDPAADPRFLGWVIAAVSISGIFVSPLFGIIANRIGRYKEVTLAGLVLATFSFIMYVNAQDFSGRKGYFLLVSRLMLGFSDGSVAVLKAYLSEATTLEERTGVLAVTNAWQGAGVIAGPAIQAVFSPLGYPGPVHVAGFRLNMYTMAGYLFIVLTAFNVLLVSVAFKEHKVAVEDDGPDVPLINDQSSPARFIPDYVGLSFTAAMYFLLLFAVSAYETVISPLTIHMYGWSSESATRNLGLLIAAMAVLSIPVFVSIGPLSNRMGERYILLGGLILLLVGYVIILPYGNDYLNARVEQVVNTTFNSSNISTSKIMVIKQLQGNCPAEYTWCTYTSKVYLPQLLIGSIILTAGFCAGQGVIFGLYSKLIGPTPQGLMMGLMAVAGTAGRMLGPVFIGHMYTSYGPRVAFIGSALIVAVFILMLLGSFRRFDTNSRKKESACGIENQGHELLESWMAPRQTHLD